MRSISLIGVALLVTGCAHTVPPIKLTHIGQGSPPTVQDVLNHISCEIKQADAENGNILSKDKYIVTVNLTLQVQDTFGLTPSINYTEALKAPSKDLVTGLGADLNNQRRRNFTTSYVIDATQLTKQPCAPPPGTDQTERLYDLTGNLRIGEIVEQGLKAGVMPGVIANAKTTPSFGSVVEFILTRGANVGPVWTLRYWKGPSGSAGLLNAKGVYTNTATLTFAPQYNAPTPPDPMAATVEQLKILNAKLDKLTAQQIEFAERLKGGARGDTKSLMQAQIDSAVISRQVEALQREINQATRDMEAAQTDERRRQSATDAAINAARNLQTDLLLQNLTPNR